MKLKKFKCFLRLLLLFVITIFIIYTLSFCTGVKTTKDGIKYIIEDDKVIITGYIGNLENLIIPSTIKKREVKVINRRAFYDNGN